MTQHSNLPPYSVDPEELLRFQIRRLVTVLFKSFLVILEDLGLDHDAALQLLYDKLPPEYRPYVELADYLTVDKGDRLRKKVLTAGNDCCRQIEEILKSFTITLKQ
jgi:hypothetical protein